MDILGLIPARGGSKSIPRKNIIDLAGKPLITHTITAALGSRRLTRVVVSTDDTEIAEVARSAGAPVPFLRPGEYAKDATGALPVIDHALTWFAANEKYVPDIVVYLQPTSPFRRAEHIDAAVELLLTTGADTVVSVVPVPHQFNPASLMTMTEGGTLVPYTDGPMVLRRQEKPVVYARNGPAILVVRTTVIQQQRTLYGSHIRGFLMRTEDSIDIDTPFDLALARGLIEYRKDPS